MLGGVEWQKKRSLEVKRLRNRVHEIGCTSRVDIEITKNNDRRMERQTVILVLKSLKNVWERPGGQEETTARGLEASFRA